MNNNNIKNEEYYPQYNYQYYHYHNQNSTNNDYFIIKIR